MDQAWLITSRLILWSCIADLIAPPDAEHGKGRSQQPKRWLQAEDEVLERVPGMRGERVDVERGQLRQDGAFDAQPLEAREIAEPGVVAAGQVFVQERGEVAAVEMQVAAA